MNREHGFQVADLTVALAVFAVLLLGGAPQLLKLSADLRVRAAASEVVAALRQAQSLAVRQNAEVAVRFAAEGRGYYTFTLYRDGDGDGVTNADIRSGVDRQVAPAGRLENLGGDVRFGIPDRQVRDPGDPESLLDRLDDPIRFNSSDLASFGPLGTATPGSVYLTDGGSHLVVVRVFGRTGKIRVLHYDFETAAWQ
jgi:type II secretory pathway pseudopilin PulG